MFGLDILACPQSIHQNQSQSLMETQGHQSKDGCVCKGGRRGLTEIYWEEHAHLLLALFSFSSAQ